MENAWHVCNRIELLLHGKCINTVFILVILWLFQTVCLAVEAPPLVVDSCDTNVKDTTGMVATYS